MKKIEFELPELSRRTVTVIILLEFAAVISVLATVIWLTSVALVWYVVLATGLVGVAVELLTPDDSPTEKYDVVFLAASVVLVISGSLRCLSQAIGWSALLQVVGLLLLLGAAGFVIWYQKRDAAKS